VQWVEKFRVPKDDPLLGKLFVCNIG